MAEQLDLTIPRLGEPKVPSPLDLSTTANDGIADFTPEGARVVLDPSGESPGLYFEAAGPRHLG